MSVMSWPGWLDYLFLFSLFMCLHSGGKRGLARELKALINFFLLAGLLVGVYVFATLNEWLLTLVKLYPAGSGLMGMLVAFVLTFWLMHKLRNQLPVKLQNSVGPIRSALWGIVLSLLRRSLVILLLLWVTLQHAPDWFVTGLVNHSMLAQKMQFLLANV